MSPKTGHPTAPVLQAGVSLGPCPQGGALSHCPGPQGRDAPLPLSPRSAAPGPSLPPAPAGAVHLQHPQVPGTRLDIPGPAEPGAAPGIGPSPNTRDAARGLTQASPRVRPPVCPGAAPASIPVQPRRPDAPVPPRRPGPDPVPTALLAGKCSSTLAVRRGARRDRTTPPSIPHAELQLPSRPVSSAGRTTTPSSPCERPCPRAMGSAGSRYREFGTARRAAAAALCGAGPAGPGPGSSECRLGAGWDEPRWKQRDPRAGFSGDSRGSDSSPPASLCSSPHPCSPHQGIPSRRLIPLSPPSACLTSPAPPALESPHSVQIPPLPPPRHRQGPGAAAVSGNCF